MPGGINVYGARDQTLRVVIDEVDRNDLVYLTFISFFPVNYHDSRFDCERRYFDTG